MPQLCCVTECRSPYDKNNGISFHCFPKQGTMMRDQWLNAIGLETLNWNGNPRVCSRHFASNDFIIGGNTRKLKKCAIPNTRLEPSCSYRQDLSSASFTVVPLAIKRCFVPTCSNTSANSFKIFISVPQQEDIGRNWCSAAGLPNIPTTTKSSYVFCCEDHFNLKEDTTNWEYARTTGSKFMLKKDVCPHMSLKEHWSDNASSQLKEDCENWMEFRMRNVKMRMKKDVTPHLNLKGRYMKNFEKYHSQLSPTSRQRRMENSEFDIIKTSSFVQEVPSTKTDERFHQTILIAPKEIPPTKFTQVQLPSIHSIPSNHTIAGDIKSQQKANTKVLFRNNNEELCISGSHKWNEKNEKDETNEVEIENGVVESKKKTEPIKETKSLKQKENESTDILQQPQLNVCEETSLYKNKEGEYFNAALEAINENEVNTEKTRARIRGENLFEISNTCSVSENFICEETGLFKNLKGEYFTEGGIPVDVREVEAEKVKAKIRGENLFQITNIHTVSEEATEKAEEVPDKTISSLDIPIAPPSPLEKLQKLVSSTESISCVDKSLNNHVLREGLIDIKEEPLEMNIEEGRVEFNYVPEDEEETLTASESASYQNLEGLLDSLDTYDKTQYVDVPEFVQINHFTLKDLENLKKQQQSLHDETQKDLFSSQNVFTTFPYDEQTIEKDINLKMLLAEHSNQLEKNPQVMPNQNMSERVAFVQSKERCRLDKILNRFPILPLPELPKYNLNRFSSGKYPGKWPIPPIMKKAAQKPRRRKVKIVAVNESETDTGKNSKANLSYPNREICVLFTNYSYDGLYINDHDYLVTPYKRNKILLKENGESFCMCFICGCKHRLEEHVIHMNLHNPKCRICNVNLGTGYMLNLHVKSHTKPCKICTDLVPYSEILEHEKKHREKELEFFENDGRKRKKKDDKDEKPVYFQLPCEDYQMSKSPRLTRSSAQVASSEVDGIQVKIVNKNNIENDKTDVTDTDTKKVEINNVEKNKVETNHVEKNNVEANDVIKTNQSATNFNDQVKADADSFAKKSSECSGMEGIEAEAISTITNNTDTKNIKMTENEPTQLKKSYSKRKRSRKTDSLSKEECDLEEKLLKICEKSKEHADKRVLRSSFLKKSSECSEIEERQAGSAKDGPSTGNAPYVPPIHTADAAPYNTDYNDDIHNDTPPQVNYIPQLDEPIITNYVPTLNILPRDVQNNTQLKVSSDGGKRKKQDDDEEAEVSDDCTSRKEIDKIEKRRRIQNKIRCQRYRNKKKKKTAAIVGSQIYKHGTITVVEEEEEKKKIKRKENNRQNSQRYRNKKRAHELINLHTDQSSKTVVRQVASEKSTRNEPYFPLLTNKIIQDKSGNKCSYLNCELTKRLDPTLRMYRFPVGDTARCQKWILHSGNEALASFHPKSLRNKYICSTHFSKEYQKLRSLPPNVVPFHYVSCDESSVEDIVPEFKVSPLLRSYSTVRGDLSAPSSSSNTA